MEFSEVISKLSEVKQYAKENFVPIIREESAKFLYDFVKENNYKNILEIGTAIGYSGSIMMSATDAYLTTVDINEKSLAVANKNFEKMGYRDRVNIYNLDAWELINQLRDDGCKFDMVFLDGAKGQYIKYLDVLIDLLDKNGSIFADNVLLQGMVESEEKIPHRKRTMVVNLRKYLKRVNEYPFETELVRLEDGIAITKIKGDK